MTTSRVLKEAEFNPRVKTYWLLSGGLILLLCIITIPLIPLWFIFGMMFTGKYLDHMSCTLTDKTLVVRKGMFNRIEKTIPLEKITDLALKQGPIMRAMELHAISVETAGSSGSSASGALVTLVGIVDTIDFRDHVLAQRDSLVSGSGPVADVAEPFTPNAAQAAIIEDIRDTLQRIESDLRNRV